VRHCHHALVESRKDGRWLLMVQLDGNPLEL
jgi:hypothetical protein